MITIETKVTLIAQKEAYYIQGQYRTSKYTEWRVFLHIVKLDEQSAIETFSIVNEVLHRIRINDKIVLKKKE